MLVSYFCRTGVGFALVLFAAQACAQAVGNSQSSSWESRLGLDFGSFGSTRSLVVLGLASIGAAWSWEESDESFSKLRESLDGGALDVPADWGNVYGNGLVIGGMSATLLVTGRLGDNENVWNAGVDLSRSLIYSGLVTGVLKQVINRKRPSGGPLSFPSGHTTSAFSSVPMAWYYGGWEFGVPVTLLASMTAVGRMEENKHYLSDVIAGAAIGLVVGWAVTSSCSEQDNGPVVMVDNKGIGVAWLF